MRNVKREIECLQRLQQLAAVHEDLLQFLRAETFLTKEELRAIRQSPEQAKLLQAKLATLSEEKKIQLLEYEWTILPVERIKITLVTDSLLKEFISEV